MSHLVIKVRDYYLIWSSVVDAPVSFGLTYPDLVRWVRREEGLKGLALLDEQMKFIERYGTGSCNIKAESLFSFNRAGPDESSLNEEEIYRAYCLRQPIRGGWLVPVAGEHS